MSKISYPQLIKDVADTYRSVTGTTDPIVVSELTTKLAEAMSSGSGDGSGIVYKSITYNEDNTITLIDSDDVEHIMECVYTDGVLTGLVFDGSSVSIQYEDGALTKIGSTSINLNNYGI